MSIYSNNGAPWWDEEIKNPDTGAALVAADTDGVVAAFEPLAGDNTPTLLTTALDWGRNLTLGIVDANSSMTKVTATITSTDGHGRTVNETLVRTGGTGTTVGSKMHYKNITIGIHVDGTVGAGADTVQVGWGDEIQVLWDIAATTDIRHRRMDSTSGVGTIDVTYQKWILSGGNIPNGTRRYYTSGRSTAA